MDRLDSGGGSQVAAGWVRRRAGNHLDSHPEATARDEGGSPSARSPTSRYGPPPAPSHEAAFLQDRSTERC